MTFVSYAQNFEDVLLWRALKDIKHGFYIDIGAQDPIVDSVSLAFYQHGWRGVHVEPTPQYAERLKEERPDETVERLAIGSSEGSLTFFQIPDTGLSTADAEIANRHREAGCSVIETQVEVLGLDVLLDRYDYKIVHWLKIDVEGFEKQVLESWKSSLVRPWILLIESTAPGTQIQTHELWEPLVLEKGYRYAYFDGLNRYYVHETRSALLDHFQQPVSIFDEFFLSGTASQPYCGLLKGQLKELGDESLKETALLTERLNESLGNAHHWWLQAVDAQTQVAAIHASSSWRLTRPWRFFGKQRYQMSAGLLQGGLAIRSAAKAGLRKPLTCGLSWLNRHPRLLEMLSSGLRKVPFLHGVMRKLYRRFVASPASPVQPPRPYDIDVTPPDQDELTEGARHVLALLDAGQGSNTKDVG